MTKHRGSAVDIFHMLCLYNTLMTHPLGACGTSKAYFSFVGEQMDLKVLGVWF